MVIANNISFKDNTEFTNLLDIIYPVGSCYMTIDSDSPASKFGGTWKRVRNALIAAVDNSFQVGGYAKVDETNGELWISEKHLPAHTHTATVSKNGNHSHVPYNRRDNQKTRFATPYSESKDISLVSFPAKGESGRNAIGWYADEFSDGHAGTTTSTNVTGEHSHTVTIDETGGGSNSSLTIMVSISGYELLKGCDAA